MSRPDSSGSSWQESELEEIDREGFVFGEQQEADQNRTRRTEAAEVLPIYE